MFSNGYQTMITKSIVALLLTILGTSVRAESLEEILRRHTEAMGGWKNLSSVRSVLITAETEIGGMKGSATTYYKAPDKLRIDLDLPIMKYSQACDGTNCWLRDQQGLTHTLSGDLKGLAITQLALDRAVYVDPKGFSGKLRLLDETIEIEGKKCYRIEITPVGGTTAEIAIDDSSFLIRRIRLVTDMATVFSFPSDYRIVEGVTMPFMSTEKTDAGISAGVTKIQKVQFGLELPDTLFALSENNIEAAGENSVTVPFELYRNHIYFDATIPGQMPLRFIFDSGAGGVGLNKDLVERLGLKRLGEIEARGVGGADVSQVYQLDSLTIAELRINDVPAYAMDLSPLEAAGTKRIDGIIGYELLSKYAITVDYEHRILIIHRGKQPSNADWGSECRLSLDFRLPYIDARVNDSAIGRFRLDTGSGSTIDFNSPFVERYRLISADRSTYHPVTAVGIGGGSSGLIGELSALELCDYRIDSFLVNYSTSETGIFSGAQTAGNIGAGVLKRFIVTFDYPNETVYFKPVSNFVQLNSIRNMAGIQLRQAGDTLLIHGVLAEHSSAEFVKPGDRVLAIAGKSTIGMTAREANQQLIGARNSRVAVNIVRANEELSVELMLDSLY